MIIQGLLINMLATLDICLYGILWTLAELEGYDCLWSSMRVLYVFNFADVSIFIMGEWRVLRDMIGVSSPIALIRLDYLVVALGTVQ